MIKHFQHVAIIYRQHVINPIWKRT